MTEPRSATRPAPTPQPATGTLASYLPDEACLAVEIGEDGLHEWFLVRAALVAAVPVALVITTRLVWL